MRGGGGPEPSGVDGAPRVTVEIERLAAGGDGVGRAGGKVVFVARSAPGDLLEAAVVEDRGTFLRARLVRVLRPSPARVSPPCPAFGSCGGCAWQHLAAPTQLEAKRAIVDDALRRIGKLELPALPPVEPSPQAYGYRHRALLHRARTPGGAFGFFRPASHDVVTLAACPVLVPPLGRLLGALAEAARGRPGAFAPVAALRADADWEGGTVRITPRDAAGAPLALGEQVPELRDAAGGALVRVWPEPAELRLGPDADALVAGGESFTQVNLAQNAALVRAALELAAPRPGEDVLDLCCGIGNLSVPAGRRGARVLGVDLDAAAVAGAAANARRAGIGDAAFRRGDAAAAARELAAAGRRFPLVMLNPPRTGARAAVDALPALGARRVLFVSCNPATLARDAAALAAHGYRLAALVPLDLFPQTPHVETLALMIRGGFL